MSPEEEHIISCLLMVFVAVSIPRLARYENTVGLLVERAFLPSLKYSFFRSIRVVLQLTLTTPIAWP